VKVLVVPSGNDASAVLRLIWPANGLAERGHDVTVTDLGWRLEVYTDDEGNPVELMNQPRFDVMVLQRMQLGRLVQAIPLLQRAGVAVVVDLDDDFEQIDRNNAAWAGTQPQNDRAYNYEHLKRACATADLVTTSTPLLAEIYAKHGRSVVVANRLPRRVCEFEHVEVDPPRIGWAGDVKTHPRDLQVTRGIVAQVLDKTGASFVQVGPGGAAALLGIKRSERHPHMRGTPECFPEEMATGFVPFEQWYASVNANIDIGIAPLAPTRFNDCKSGLKLLEHSALGIPCVVTPTPDNMRLHALGMGIYARKPRDWERELTKLATDAGWRGEVAARSKEAARSEVLEDHLHEWSDAWELARDHHQWRRG